MPILDLVGLVVFVLMLIVVALGKFLTYGRIKLGLEHLPVVDGGTLHPNESYEVVKLYEVDKGRLKIAVDMTLVNLTEKLLEQKGLEYNAKILPVGHTYAWIEQRVKDYLEGEAWR